MSLKKEDQVQKKFKWQIWTIKRIAFFNPQSMACPVYEPDNSRTLSENLSNYKKKKNGIQCLPLQQCENQAPRPTSRERELFLLVIIYFFQKSLLVDKYMFSL